MKVRVLAVVSLLALAGIGTALMAGAGRAPGAAPAPTIGAYTIDALHTSVVFKIQRTNGAPFYGTFKKVAGSFTIDPANLSASLLDVTIPVESIDSNSDGRDKHLKGADFFSAAEFPDLTFKSTSFTKTGDNRYEIVGDLTARGVTKPVTLKALQTGAGPAGGGGGIALGFDITFSLKRSDFGIAYGPKVLGDEITVMVGLEGLKK